MVRKIFTIFIFATALASAQYRYDITERRWTLPKLTPIIEANRDRGGDPDPFGEEQALKTIESFNQDQILLWLKTSGIPFPKGSSAKYVEKANGESILTVKNTPQNLGLIDYVLSKKHPVHTSLQLMERFLAETENQKAEELLPIIRKYPAQTLGPLQSIVEALAELDLQVTSKPDQKLKEVIVKRRARIIKMLPESIKSTRTYFETMVKIMAQ